jgi:hypothetical protein
VEGQDRACAGKKSTYTYGIGAAKPGAAVTRVSAMKSVEVRIVMIGCMRGRKGGGKIV